MAKIFGIYARGLRNAVGLEWVVTNCGHQYGRDNRGPDKPEEQLIEDNRGRFLRWPYYFRIKNKLSPILRSKIL